MTVRTHVATGILVGEMLFQLQLSKDFESYAIILAAASIGAVFPDIDYQYSTITKSTITTRVVSSGISKVTNHRGIIHTPLLCILCSATLLFLLTGLHVQTYLIISFAFFIGLLSHLLLDTLNPSGIMWLFPFNRRHYNILKIRTGSLAEMIIRIPIVIAVIITTYGIFNTLIPEFIKNLNL